jgi:hypothetical protein
LTVKDVLALALEMVERDPMLAGDEAVFRARHGASGAVGGAAYSAYCAERSKSPVHVLSQSDRIAALKRAMAVADEAETQAEVANG